MPGSCPPLARQWHATRHQPYPGANTRTRSHRKPVRICGYSPLMSRAPKSLFDALADTPAAASLLERVAASERAARVIAGAASIPGFDPLRPGCCELRDGTLVLRTSSSAIAAKLRQSLPSLLGALQRQGAEVIEIRVRVQPERSGYPTQGSSPHTPDDMPVLSGSGPTAHLSRTEARAFADKLALTLTESPLRSAAEKLSRRLRRVT